MTGKQVAACIGGGVFLLLGFGFMLLATLSLLRNMSDAWLAGGSVAALLLGAYFLWCGARLILWANGKWDREVARVKWGPVCIGAIMLFVQAKNHFHPSPNLLKPDNETQAQAMAATAVILTMVWIFLIFWGFFAKFRKAETSADSNRA